MSKFLRKSCRERVIAAFLGLAFVYIMLIQTKTLWSGYHFLDDHELVRIEASLAQGTPLWDQIRIQIDNDLQIRYRPLYWVERTTGIALLGSDLFAWNLCKAVMAAVTFYLLYMTGYYLRQRWHISALFAAVIMVGPQITPWYRSANQENTGLFLCALVLYLTARQYNRQKFRHVGYNLLIVVSAVLCSLEKESFVLMLPAFGAVKYWLEYTAKDMQHKENGDGKGLWWECVKSNLIVYLLLAAAFFFHLYMLLFRVGVDKVSYAGFRKETPLREYLNGIRYSLTRFLTNYVWFAVILTLLLVVCYQVFDRRKIKYAIGMGVIGCFIMGIQLLAHAKSMMWERYIIPFIIGYALVFVLTGYWLLAEDALRRRVYAGALTAMVLMYAFTARGMAHSYTQDGELINGYLNYILENTEEEDHIIGAYADEELNLASASWLEAHGRKKEYSYNWYTGELKDYVHLSEKNEETTDWISADAAVCYSIDADKIVSMMGLTGADSYLRQQYGQYAVIIRQ
ncbi:MAG: glycosyltransferase family 39 protein [Acetatifactor sp.]|nr:glycosyltransferase family 39 protein [Acetatifactor sp.]